eukprot:8908756-Lingulodinium_polyedra.AAC.1
MPRVRALWARRACRGGLCLPLPGSRGAARRWLRVPWRPGGAGVRGGGRARGGCPRARRASTCRGQPSAHRVIEMVACL